MVESTLYLVHALHCIPEKLPLRSTKGSANILASLLTRRFLIIQNTVRLERNVRIFQFSFWKVFIQGGNIHSLKENTCGTRGFEELLIFKKLYFLNFHIDLLLCVMIIADDFDFPFLYFIEQEQC